MFEILIMLVITWLHNLIKPNELYIPKGEDYMEIILQLDSNKSYFKKMKKSIQIWLIKKTHNLHMKIMIGEKYIYVHIYVIFKYIYIM